MATPHVVILGGGYGGVAAARGLRDRARVTLVSETNFLLFTPMLAEVASGDVDPRHIITPLRRLVPGARVVQGTVEAIDTEGPAVRVRSPLGLEPVEISGDALVIALGSVPATLGIPGVTEHALFFKSIGDGLRIRNRMLALLEAASERRDPHLTTLAIVGAGYSGVELAGALADFLRPAAKRYFPDAPRPYVNLVDAVHRVTPTLSPGLSRSAERALLRRGVRLELGARVAAVSERGLRLEDGRTIDAATVIWSAGVGPHPLLATLPLDTQRGRLVVDSTLRAGRERVFALGDAAVVPDGRGGVSPPTAQFALRQGRYLGAELPRLLDGEQVEAFRYRGMGELVSIGHRNAVGRVLGVSVSGFSAWFLWRSYYLSRLPTLHRKARVALDWTLDLLFPPDVAWLPSSDLGPAP